jgi:hypothetical protein
VTRRPVPALFLMMKTLVLAALVVAIAACGAYHFPSASPAGTGTVTGTVLAVPCAPVVNPQFPCKGRPAAGLVMVFTAGNGTPAEAQTDSAGHYTIHLDAGTWNVTVKGHMMRIVSGPATVTVAAGATTVADYFVDSGIRLPVPLPAS